MKRIVRFVALLEIAALFVNLGAEPLLAAGPVFHEPAGAPEGSGHFSEPVKSISYNEANFGFGINGYDPQTIRKLDSQIIPTGIGDENAAAVSESGDVLPLSDREEVREQVAENPAASNLGRVEELSADVIENSGYSAETMPEKISKDRQEEISQRENRRWDHEGRREKTGEPFAAAAGVGLQEDPKKIFGGLAPRKNQGKEYLAGKGTSETGPPGRNDPPGSGRAHRGHWEPAAWLVVSAAVAGVAMQVELIRSLAPYFFPKELSGPSWAVALTSICYAAGNFLAFSFNPFQTYAIAKDRSAKISKTVLTVGFASSVMLVFVAAAVGGQILFVEQNLVGVLQYLANIVLRFIFRKNHEDAVSAKPLGSWTVGRWTIGPLDRFGLFVTSLVSAVIAFVVYVMGPWIQGLGLDHIAWPDGLISRVITVVAVGFGGISLPQLFMVLWNRHKGNASKWMAGTFCVSMALLAEWAFHRLWNTMSDGLLPASIVFSAMFAGLSYVTYRVLKSGMQMRWEHFTERGTWGARLSWLYRQILEEASRLLRPFPKLRQWFEARSGKLDWASSVRRVPLLGRKVEWGLNQEVGRETFATILSFVFAAVFMLLVAVPIEDLVMREFLSVNPISDAILAARQTNAHEMAKVYLIENILAVVGSAFLVRAIHRFSDRQRVQADPVREYVRDNPSSPDLKQ